MCGISGQNLHPETIQEPTESILIRKKRHLITQEILRTLQVLCQEPE